MLCMYDVKQNACQGQGRLLMLMKVTVEWYCTWMDVAGFHPGTCGKHGAAAGVQT